MSIKATGKSASNKSVNTKNPHPYVVPESDIRNYVNSVGIHDLRTVAARFQVVADLTSNAFEESKDRLKPSHLRLLKRLADQDNSARYRRIMRAIVAAVGQRQHGINAAHLTANVAVGMIFRWSPEYRSALEGYRNTLRRQKRRTVDRRSLHRAGRRSALPLTNDQ